MVSALVAVVEFVGVAFGADQNRHSAVQFQERMGIVFQKVLASSECEERQIGFAVQCVALAGAVEACRVAEVFREVFLVDIFLVLVLF